VTTQGGALVRRTYDSPTGRMAEASMNKLYDNRDEQPAGALTTAIAS
jgi:hypothetical protein